MTGKEYVDKEYKDLNEGMKGIIAKAFDAGLKQHSHDYLVKTKKIRDEYEARLEQRNRELLESCEGATMMYKDLCKAKELLRFWVNDFYDSINHSHSYEERHKALEQSEQFLKETKDDYVLPKDLLGLWEATICEIRGEIKSWDLKGPHVSDYAKGLCDKLEHSMCALAGGPYNLRYSLG